MIPFLSAFFSLCSLLYNLKLVLCAFLCNRSIRPNVLMNESWSHVVGSQPHTSRFIFFAVSCLTRHQSSMNCSLRGSVKFLGWIQATSFESLRWFCDFYLPRRSNIIIESWVVLFIFFIFGGSDYFPINCKISKKYYCLSINIEAAVKIMREKCNERQQRWPEICAHVPLLFEVSRCSILCPYREWLLGMALMVFLCNSLWLLIESLLSFRLLNCSNLKMCLFILLLFSSL